VFLTQNLILMKEFNHRDHRDHRERGTGKGETAKQH